MIISELALPGVFLITPDIHSDDRGFFLENWNVRRYIEAGFPDVRFVQSNHSQSRRGVLRGMHFQLRNPQGKLLQVIRGAVLDVAVDLRVGSPTFGGWVAEELNESLHRQLYVPPGFAHGFCALTDCADLVYLCTSVYDAASDGGVVWNDPEIGIDWPISRPILSARDKGLPTLRQARDAGLLPSVTA